MTFPNDPAFPFGELSSGLSIREHFAAMAMQSLRRNMPGDRAAFVARLAVEDADALIDELNKEPTHAE